MTKRMLIDTTHAEETRVVVLDGNRLEDYDVETSAKKQLKGNIYLAKVVRVEPSLQAAFVEYGGNRHGFLAFSEIHPDYYQIPVADRERLIALQEEEARAEEARDLAREASGEDEPAEADDGRDSEPRHAAPEGDAGDQQDEPDADAAALPVQHDTRHGDAPGAGQPYPDSQAYPDSQPYPDGGADSDSGVDRDGSADAGFTDESGQHEDRQPDPAPETMGGEVDNSDDGRAAPQSARFLRQYKIQEVIRRRQILLIQVVKEERGNKGAALTTYISLAGRFCVLMPNSLRGGGVSRKITSAADRRRLKEITTELDIPRGMAMIIRTAGAQRPRPEIRRDCKYLLRLWDDIREQTMRAMAPALINEEANLIKRAIRDVYTRDIDEISVDGEQGWKAAREFMRNLMPANAQKVILWRDHGQPLFSYYQVEHHLDAMLQPTVQLRSGGYLVINQTEALVAIDVNSGRSTRERGIEETALRTNLEAADEVARQLRLRDLAGLIVIDFIDMEARKHNVMVERRMKEALKNDRARLQLGTISHFGLMEMSRQRLRPSIAESSFVACTQCAGTGFVRGTDSAALHVLRAIEEEGGKQRAAEIVVYAASAVVLYVLNQKRVWLGEIEQRHRMTVHFAVDDSLIPPQVRIEKMKPQVAAPLAPQVSSPAAQAVPQPSLAPQPAFATLPASEVAAERHLPANGVITHGIADAAEIEDADDDEFDGAETPAAPALQDNSPAAAAVENGDDEHRRKRRRRRRRGGRREDANGAAAAAPQDAEQPDIDHAGIYARSPEPEDEIGAQPAGAGGGPSRADDPDREAGSPAAHEVPLSEELGQAPRKRGRRGGARGRKPRDGAVEAAAEVAQQGADLDQRIPEQRAYNGPTPANPFGGTFDIFDMIEQDVESPEAAAAERTPVQAGPIPEPEPDAAPAEPPEPFVEAMPEVQPEGVPESATEAAPEVLPEAASSLAPDPVSTAEIGADVGAETAAMPDADAPAKPKRRRAATPRVKAADEPIPAAVPAKVAKPRMTKARKAELAAAAAAAEPAQEAIDLTAADSVAAAAAVAPEPAEPRQDERPGNVLQPILIDAADAPPARRTGWWKR